MQTNEEKNCEPESNYFYPIPEMSRYTSDSNNRDRIKATRLTIAQVFVDNNNDTEIKPSHKKESLVSLETCQQ